MGWAFSRGSCLDAYGVESRFVPGLDCNFRQQERKLRIALVITGAGEKGNGYQLSHFVDLGDVDSFLCALPENLSTLKLSYGWPEISLSK